MNPLPPAPHALASRALAWAVAAALALPAALPAADLPMRVQSPASAGSQPVEPTAAPRPAANASPGEGAAPGGLMDRAVDSGSQVYVDDSFASVEKLRTAMRLDQQKQTQLAIQRYQEIIDDFGQKLVYLNNDFYVSLTDYVRQKLLAMPGVQKGEYEQLYGPQAAKEINAAVSAGDVAALIRSCDRYFPSSAAVDGLSRAAEWYFERAEFAAAARTWESLVDHPRAAGRQALFLHHAALAEHLAGRPAVAQDLRARLAKDFADARGQINAQEVTLLDSLDALLNLPVWDPPTLPPDEWPTFQGSPARIALTDVGAMASARLWSQSLSPARDTTPTTADLVRARPVPMVIRGRAIIASSGGQPDVGPALSSYPVMSNGVLFINSGDTVLAMNANAGTLLWSYPPQNTPASDVAAMEAISSGVNLRLPDHDSCTIYGDQVFAVLPAAPGGRQQRLYYGYGSLPNTRVVALNRSTGHEDWSFAAADLPLDVKGSLAFVGSPLVTRQGVFAVARKSGGDTFTQLYLVRLDRQSGAVTWTCYLCSASTGGNYGYSIPLTVPLAALADDVVYVSTGQGADCAVDANAGRILWLQVTESAKSLPGSGGPYGRPYEVVSSWKFNPPLVYKDRLITAENGAAIRIYDRWSGRLLGRINPKELDNASIVAGIVGDVLVTVGGKVHGIDLTTGKEAWDPVSLPPNADAGMVTGRPFLTEKFLYVPMDKGLAMLEMPKPSRVELTAWPKGQGPDNKETLGRSGNLLVTNEQIIVVNDSEIVGYSRWETARDKRLDAIARNPRDPKNYLDLAEIAFRTGHYDLAQTNMRQAVELAVNPQVSTEPDFLDRIYRINLTFAQQLMSRDDKDLRDQARFYFDQCRLAARNPETNAEWRLVMAPFSLVQERFDEAAELYNQVLTDPALRNATFRYASATGRAGIIAESRFRNLILDQGRIALGASELPDTPEGKAQAETAGRQRIYKRFEDQAAALLARARTQPDPNAFRSLVEAYPNSLAAIDAAGELARLYLDRGDPVSAAETLRWSYVRVVAPQARARLAADLALSNLAMKRYATAWNWADRGRRHFADLTWNANGKSYTFASLREELRAAAPGPIEPLRPALALPAEGKPAVATLGAGMLLTPTESDPFLQRPDLIVSFASGTVTFRDAATLKTRSTCALPQSGGAMLLGFVGDRAFFATGRGAAAIDVNTGNLAWEARLEMSADERVRYNDQVNRARNIQAQQVQQVNNVIGGPAPAFVVVDDDMAAATRVAAWMDQEHARAAQFQTVLGTPGFQTMRLLGNRLVAISGREIKAYSLETGKHLWYPVTLPADGVAAVVVGNDDSLVVQLDSPDRGTPTFIAVDAATGRNQRTLKLDNEHVFWRALAEDGSFYTVSDIAVAAWDIRNDTSRPRWRRDDIHTRFPAASVLTLDGLVMVDSNNDLNCLSPEAGEPRWDRSNRISINVPQGATPFLTATLDGPNVNIQSSGHVAAYRTADGEKVWGDPFAGDEQNRPMFQPAQIGNPYLVILASGPTPRAQREVLFYFFNRINPVTRELTNGKLENPIRLPRSAETGESEGPNIRNWQLVNGGVVFEVNGTLRMLQQRNP